MAQTPAHIFREYDIRGEAETELSSPNVRAIARAFGTYLKRCGIGKASVGGDVRLSTERIRTAVISGLLESGVDVVDLGVVTTPILYWSFYRFSLDGGVMITGSHNPKEMNGLKLGCNKSTLWGEEIQTIRRMTEADDFDVPEHPGTLTRQDIIAPYCEMLASKFSFSRPMKVVIDAANGTAALCAPQFFRSLGCEVVPLYCTPDGTFPNHHPDPQKRVNMTDLARAVVETGADAGFGFDGDADRIGVVDDKGEIIWGDILMALFWQEILPRHRGADVLIEVKCSQALEDEVRRLGGTPRYCKAGHSLIKAEMKRIGALFAGEYSGHMFFADEYYGFDDSFYAAARLLRILDRSGEKLSVLHERIPHYFPTEEIRVDCPDEKKFEVMKVITWQAVQDSQAHTVEGARAPITVDGVRILYKNGWGLIRASNTQPVLSVRCEGRTPYDRDIIAYDIRRRVTAEGLPYFKWKI